MFRTVSLLFSLVLFLTTQAQAGLINFEFTVEDVSGDGSEYAYDFQFWIDITDPGYSSTLGFNSIDVNISDRTLGPGPGPRPFGSNFIVTTSPGFVATDFTSAANFTGIRPEGPGFNFWQPTADDFAVRFTGLSSVLAPDTPMTWNYFGRNDVDNSATPISGAPVHSFLVANPVDALTNFTTPPDTPPDTPNGVPVPSSLPLLLAGLGIIGLRRPRGSRKSLSIATPGIAR